MVLLRGFCEALHRIFVFFCWTKTQNSFIMIVFGAFGYLYNNPLRVTVKPFNNSIAVTTAALPSFENFMSYNDIQQLF